MTLYSTINLNICQELKKVINYGKYCIMEQNSHTIKEKMELTRPGLLFAILMLIFGIQLIKSQILPTRSIADDLTTQNILQSVNNERNVRNLAILATNDKLTRAGQIKADDMQARHYFSHTNPEGDYIWPLITKEGYTPYLQLGENLAIEFYNTESLVSAWMNSPTHRANILNENFKDQGIGLTLGNVQNNEYYSAIVNTFGTLIPPKKQTSSPSPQTSLPQKQTTSKKVLTSSVKTSTPKPAETKISSTTNKIYTPIAIRGAELEQPSFSLPPQNQTAPTTTNTTTTKPALQTIQKNKAVASQNRTNMQNNRIISLGFGFILLYMLVKDIFFIEKKQGDHKDKKINNLVLLILSLIVVAVMYWL